MSDATRVELTRPALRDLKRLDPPVRRRILEALEGLAEVPPRGDVRRLAGEADGDRGARVYQQGLDMRGEAGGRLEKVLGCASRRPSRRSPDAGFPD